MQLYLNNNTDYVSLVKKSIIGIASLHFGYKVTKWLFDYTHKVWVTNKIPGVFMYPFLGNSNLFMEKHSAFLRGFLACVLPFKDKTICRFWIGTQPYISFHTADNLDVIFDSTKHTKKSYDYQFLTQWLGDGLLMSDGEKYHSRRKLITPTFHFDILKDFYEIMNAHCDIMIEDIAKAIASNSNIHLGELIAACALDTISETAMGYCLNTQKEQNSEYLKAVEIVAKTVHLRVRTPWYWYDTLFNLTAQSRLNRKSLKIVHDFTNKVIKERLDNFQEITTDKGKWRTAFLDIMIKAHLEDPTEVRLEDIREEVDTIMFAGHDTTTAAVEWACYNIARNPEIQNEIYKELQSVVGNSSRNLTIDDLNELKYLECVIKESMRIIPTVGIIMREFTEDCIIEGYKVLKGTSALIFIHQIHQDERYFPEPEKFIPERFLAENSANRPAYAFIPFSAGKRNCIGQRYAMLEYKLLVANIIRNFELSCSQTIEDLILEVKMIMKTENPIIFNIKKRSIE